MFIDLSDKTALVCGASQGIGAATAIALAKLNCNVILLARNESKLQTILAEINSFSDKQHTLIAIDNTDRALLEEHVKEMLSAYGHIDILINNTGGPAGGPIVEAEEERFIVAFNQHLLVNQLLSRLLLPGMKEQGFGRIINITSTSVLSPIPNLGVSNTIRAAVASWAKTLASEVGKYGITVNNILPGYTQTPRLDKLLQKTAERQGCHIDVVKEKWQGNVPARRFAHPDEVAAAIAFLASPAASYINGINLPVDGGRSI